MWISRRKNGMTLKAAFSMGFSLPELMITLAIMGILSALALPAMNDFLERNKISSLSNEFLGLINYARNEAVARNGRVVICMANVPPNPPAGFVPSCRNSGSGWERGWIVFQDMMISATANGYDAGTDVLLKVKNEVEGGYTMTSGTPRRVMAFNSTGVGSLAGADSITIAPQSGGANLNSRVLCIDSAGRARVIDNTANCNAGVITNR